MGKIPHISRRYVTSNKRDTGMVESLVRFAILPFLRVNQPRSLGIVSLSHEGERRRVFTRWVVIEDRTFESLFPFPLNQNKNIWKNNGKSRFNDSFENLIPLLTSRTVYPLDKISTSTWSLKLALYLWSLKKITRIIVNEDVNIKGWMVSVLQCI